MSKKGLPQQRMKEPALSVVGASAKKGWGRQITETREKRKTVKSEMTNIVRGEMGSAQALKNSRMHISRSLQRKQSHEPLERIIRIFITLLLKVLSFPWWQSWATASLKHVPKNPPGDKEEESEGPRTERWG